MSETENKSNNRLSGQIQISDGVIEVIAGTAVEKTEGIAALAGNFAGGIIEKISNKKNYSNGIDIIVEDNIVTVNVGVLIYFGRKIYETALDVQKNVKTAIENMTGLKVSGVNVNVVGLEYEKCNSNETISETE